MQSARTQSSEATGRPVGRAPGFTLLEILLVVFLLSLLALSALPALHHRLASASLPEAADRFRSLMYLARSHAMMEQRRVRIRFESGQQQPYVEVEPEPVLQPGQFVQIMEDWATESPLLDGVHVHDVIPGRPAYLTPVATNGEATTDDLIGAETTTDLESAQSKEAEQVQKAESTVRDDKADEKRPNLIFDTDGSTDWATIVLAEVPSNEELSDSLRQYWVVLDGRTGLAKVTEGITAEKLASAELTIPREKLIRPKKADVKDLTFNVPTDPSAFGSMFGAGGGAMGQKGGLPGQPGGATGPTETPQTPQLPQTPAIPQGATGLPAQGDTMAELEKQLANSDLSDAEKAEIRKSFQQDLKTAGK